MFVFGVGFFCVVELVIFNLVFWYMGVGEEGWIVNRIFGLGVVVGECFVGCRVGLCSILGILIRLYLEF